MQPIVLYTVDDEPWAVSFWDLCEFDDAFPGVVYKGADNLETAMEFAQSNPSTPTVFVLDSRMHIRKSEFDTVARFLEDHFDVEVRTLREDKTLSGVFVGAWIRSQSDNFRIILLTAFAKDIKESEKHERNLGALISKSITEVVLKPSDECEIRPAVRRCVSEVRNCFRNNELR